MTQLTMTTGPVAARRGAVWRGAVWRPIRWCVAAALLGACAAVGPPDLTTSRAYRDMTSDALYERTLQAVRASDLEVTESDQTSGVITAVGRFEDRDWAECPEPLKLIDDQSSTQHMVEAVEDHREVELTASVTDGPEGATLTLDPAFFTEPVSAMATTEECRTPRALERQILAAVAETA